MRAERSISWDAVRSQQNIMMFSFQQKQCLRTGSVRLVQKTNKSLESFSLSVVSGSEPRLDAICSLRAACFTCTDVKTLQESRRGTLKHMKSSCTLSRSLVPVLYDNARSYTTLCILSTQE
jgi:hypothetical protein